MKHCPEQELPSVFLGRSVVCVTLVSSPSHGTQQTLSVQLLDFFFFLNSFVSSIDSCRDLSFSHVRRTAWNKVTFYTLCEK